MLTRTAWRLRPMNRDPFRLMSANLYPQRPTAAVAAAALPVVEVTEEANAAIAL